MSSIDDIVQTHADNLQKIYDDRTAGSHTFTGALAHFLNDLAADCDAVESLSDRHDQLFAEDEGHKREDQVLLAYIDPETKRVEPVMVTTRERVADFMVTAEKIRQEGNFKTFEITEIQI